MNGSFVPPIVHQYDRAYEATKVGSTAAPPCAAWTLQAKASHTAGLPTHSSLPPSTLPLSRTTTTAQTRACRPPNRPALLDARTAPCCRSTLPCTP